jgi:hypothetical protein
MQHPTAQQALDELNEDAVLPHPVRLRDLILRTRLDPATALELNREFQSYLTHYGEAERQARTILSRLAALEPKQAG